MSSNKVDEKFLQIVEQMIAHAIRTTAQCSGEILKISESYLEADTQKKICSFYNLYFSADLNQAKSEMNSEVDDLVDSVRAQLEDGKEVVLDQVDEKDEERRLGLAAMQKELEGLITLGKGISDQLAPVLSSMQFEDGARQRLEHISFAWGKVLSVNGDESKVDFDAIKGTVSSIEETKTYYQEVLGEDPPENQGAPESGIMFF